MGKNFRDTLNERMKDPAFLAEWNAQEPERQIMRAIAEGREEKDMTQKQLAEITGIPYASIVVAAILPAVLYFTGIFLMVHFEGKRLGLKGLPKDSIPHFFRLLGKSGYLLIPVVVLVICMNYYTAGMSACFFARLPQLEQAGGPPLFLRREIGYNAAMNQVIQEKLKLLPDAPGVYRMYDAAGQVIYVG